MQRFASIGCVTVVAFVFTFTEQQNVPPRHSRLLALQMDSADDFLISAALGDEEKPKSGQLVQTASRNKRKRVGGHVGDAEVDIVAPQHALPHRVFLRRLMGINTCCLVTSLSFTYYV